MKLPRDFPCDLFTAEQVRQLDRRANIEFAVPGILLMKRAGLAALECLLHSWPAAQAVSVWCGAGNNAGDGYVLAGLAINRGMQVQLVQVGDEARLQGDARQAFEWALQQGVSLTSFGQLREIEGDVLVDALLGTGLSGPSLRTPFDAAIERINQSGKPVLALDIPSGLNSDTGMPCGKAVRAQVTLTFIGVKQGLLTGMGPSHCGQLIYADLDVPEALLDTMLPAAKRISSDQFDAFFAPRSPDAHKGQFGHVLIVGGNLGLGGAVIMAAQAAGRVGAGLVSVATRPEHVSALLARCPEVMAHGVSSGQDLEPLAERANVLVVGPGLGTNAWSEQMLRVALASKCRLVLDADALNLLAVAEVQVGNPDWLITPHPGEAARLLQLRVAQVQADRFAAVSALQQRYAGVAVLKGAGTLIDAGKGAPLRLCSQGNPGMASGGMGDVLSGVLGGLLAQGLDLEAAACVGVCLHAAAADRAALEGERGLLATDLMGFLRALVNPNKPANEE